MKNTRPSFSRAPNGILSRKPIYVCLSEDENVLFKQRALAEHRSLSSMARMLILQSLAANQEQSNPLSMHAHAAPIVRS